MRTLDTIEKQVESLKISNEGNQKLKKSLMEFRNKKIKQKDAYELKEYLDKSIEELNSAKSLFDYAKSDDEIDLAISRLQFAENKVNFYLKRIRRGA